MDSGLQHIRVRLQKYIFQLHYKPGPEIHISDALPRALPVPSCIMADTSPISTYRIEDENTL